MILHMAEYSEENQIFRVLLSDYSPQQGYPDFALNFIHCHAGSPEKLLRMRGGPERMRSIFPDFNPKTPESGIPEFPCSLPDSGCLLIWFLSKQVSASYGQMVCPEKM